MKTLFVSIDRVMMMKRERERALSVRLFNGGQEPSSSTRSGACVRAKFEVETGFAIFIEDQE